MRVFVASLCHETSAFSPIPTSRKSFEWFDFHRPADGKPDKACRELNGYGAFVRRAEADGHDVRAGLYAWTQPSARTVRAAYESLRDEILDDLARFNDVDMVLLFLHGAQMAEGYDDCEGDLLKRAREIVGDDVFIGALLDLHGNISQDMLNAANVLVACRHYPHIDFDERAEHLYDIGVAAAKGEVSPTSHFVKIPMIGMFATTLPRMAAVNDAALELQQSDGVLSVTLIHGFLWSDIPDCGAGVLVVTDGPSSTADTDARALAKIFFAARDETASRQMPIGDILDKIETGGSDEKPYVIADTCDNAGGGAGSDSTFILQAILDRQLTGYGLALLWDPGAVQFARDAGPGARLPLRLGGKTGPRAGTPLDVSAEVLSIKDGIYQHGIGYKAPMGLVAALNIAGNVVIVNSVRGQVFSPTVFTDLGVDLAQMKALIVKSSQHFYDQFAPIARDVLYCTTPGSLSLNLSPESFSRLNRPIWPLDQINDW